MTSKKNDQKIHQKLFNEIMGDYDCLIDVVNQHIESYIKTLSDEDYEALCNQYDDHTN